MQKLNHPVEKIIETIIYKDIEFEVVERPDVIWVGCVDYAKDNTIESDTNKTLKRYQELVGVAPKKEIINDGWSAALSINYGCADKPCGTMFANECYTDKQDERYDLITQPSGTWFRVRNDADAAKLVGYDGSEEFNPWKYGPYMYFDILKNVAKENGYTQNPDIHIEIEYHCDAEYNTPPHTSYAYIPIVKI